MISVPGIEQGQTYATLWLMTTPNSSMHLLQKKMSLTNTNVEQDNMVGW